MISRPPRNTSCACSGRVNVNRATTKDMMTVLGITDKDAGAIADYRKANGEFKDFDALSKVPESISKN